MISVLKYFRNTLANVGLTKASLEYDSNFVTRIENKYVRCESNRIGKAIEYNQIEITIEYNQIEKTSDSNPFGNGCQHGTADADDGASVGYLMQLWAGS